jgi:2-alkyl-3-oxoalkanoate reductase
VRREGTAPDGVVEVVGDFADASLAASVVDGADAVVTTVYAMGSGDRAHQATVSVDGTTTLARAAAAAGVGRLVHLSTAGVYDRTPAMGDVAESSPLVGDDGGDYATVKRDTDAALAGVDGLTRVLLRPPAILGPGETSVWNSVIPAEARDDADERHAVPTKSLPWVHVEDLAAFAADVATGAVADSGDPEAGPVAGGCTPVNVAAGAATWREYLGAVCDAVGVEPVWDDGPAWTGRIVADRAARWGFSPAVTFDDALAEVVAGLRA